MSDPLEVIAEQLVTANMIAVFQNDGLMSSMTWAEANKSMDRFRRHVR